jgi:serine/threonine protein kinase
MDTAVSKGPSTSEVLLAQLTQRQLVDSARLQGWVERFGREEVLAETPAEALRLMVRDHLLTSYQASRILAGEIGSLVVGKYRLLIPLGAASDAVYLAESRALGSRVALKVLSTKHASPTARERFRREAQALARLQHPHIVHINDFDEHDGHLVLLMEYIEGESLAGLVEREGPLQPIQAAQLIRDVALGLEQVHAAGLVHRDIKPSHLMKDQHGLVKILDFGLARFLDDQAGSLTLQFDSDRVLGSVEYQAPEQLVNSHDVDIRADLYGLGGTFYFLLTGRAPFSRAALLRLANGVVTHPQPLWQLRPDVPRELTAAVERMMAHHRGERFQTPREVIDVLEEWLAEACPTTTLSAPGRPKSAPILGGPTRPKSAPILGGPTRPKSAPFLNASPNGPVVSGDSSVSARSAPPPSEPSEWISLVVICAVSLVFFLGMLWILQHV